MNKLNWPLRRRTGARLLLGAAVALGQWPCTVGCGATTRADNDGTSARAGASNAAGASGGFAVAGALASGGSSGDEAASGHAEEAGRSFGGQSSGGDGSALGGSTEDGGATSSSSGRAGNGEGGTNAISCVGAMAHFPQFDRSCSTASDCSVVAHTTNCCGSRLAMAIATSEIPAFDSAEAICDAQYPACGCAAQGVQVEDGTQVGWTWKTEVKASCDSGNCKAHYVGATFSCGASTCTDKQYCSMSSGGPAGTAPSANCVQTACTDCACLKLDSVTCSCSVPDGHLVVSCQRA